jgi:glycosyltransferase involved in cell wall biosynthesis
VHVKKSTQVWFGLHICMITPEFPSKLGGISYYVYNLSKELVKKGHRVSVITRGSYKGLQVRKVDGINVCKTGFIPIYPFHIQLHGFITNKFFKFFESEFDIIHLHGGLLPIVQTSLPKIVTVHSLTKMEDYSTKLCDFHSLTIKLFSRFIFPWERRVISSGNIITSVSNFVARELETYYGLDKDKIYVVGNGVNTDFFTPKSSSSKGDVRYVLYSGRLSYEKGLLDLVASARYVCMEYPDLHFVIAGKGPLERRLKKLVSKIGLDNKFFFVGQADRNRILKLYQNAIVYVQPSYCEGLPTSLLEAMASGIPIVATSAGGIPDLVVNNETGFLVPPKNPRAMANALVVLLEDAKLRKRIGELARKRVERCFSWKAISNKLLNCYDLIIND